MVSSCSRSYESYGPAGLLCPWDSPGENTGVCCHALLQGIYPTEGLNSHLLCLLTGRVLYQSLVPLGKPHMQQEMYTKLFTAALFIIVKNQKEYKCSLSVGRIEFMVQSHDGTLSSNENEDNTPIPSTDES